MSDHSVIPEKPNLSLYFGQVVKDVIQGADDDTAYQWYIEFENGVRIINHSRDETHPPTDYIGWKFMSMSMSVHDTTLHFRDPATLFIRKFSLKPTSYTIHDPRHGGEVIPQWPEELEEAGIAPEDIGKVSDPPPETWAKDYEQITRAQDAKRQSDAQEFLEEDENASTN